MAKDISPPFFIRSSGSWLWYESVRLQAGASIGVLDLSSRCVRPNQPMGQAHWLAVLNLKPTISSLHFSHCSCPRTNQYCYGPGSRAKMRNLIRRHVRGGYYQAQTYPCLWGSTRRYGDASLWQPFRQARWRQSNGSYWRQRFTKKPMSSSLSSPVFAKCI